MSSSFIDLHDRDNVGICKAALPAGVHYADKDVTLLRNIPALLKFTIRSNSKIFAHMNEDMDLNCGKVLDGEVTLEQNGQEMF